MTSFHISSPLPLLKFPRSAPTHIHGNLAGASRFGPSRLVDIDMLDARELVGGIPLVLADEVDLGGTGSPGARVGAQVLLRVEEDGDGGAAAGGRGLGRRGEVDRVRLRGRGDVVGCHAAGVCLAEMLVGSDADGPSFRVETHCGETMGWQHLRRPGPWASCGCGGAQHIWGAGPGRRSP